MFETLFESTGMMPHGICLLWLPELLALYVIGDGATGLAYLSISFAIVSFLRRKRCFEYRWVGYLFACFIVLCGLSHFADILVLWQPYYGLDGLLKFAMAVISTVTAMVLWPLIPEMLRIQSPRLLEAANVQLGQEIEERRHAETALRAAHDELERRVAERTAALARSEERVRLAVEAADVGLWEYDLEDDCIVGSTRANNLIGYDEADRITLGDFEQRVHPADLERARRYLASAWQDGFYHAEFRVVRPDNSISWIETRGRVVFEGTGASRKPVRLIGAVIDVTEQVTASEELKASLAEKETLLREVHHRVKNNLQSLLSLIQLETRRQHRQIDTGVLCRLNALRNRIQVMASIHKSLYTSDTVSLVEMGVQLPILCENIRSISPRPDLLSVHVVCDPLWCDLDTAIPLGMLVHEIVTNSVKHAFPDDRSGRIDVSAHCVCDTVCLVVVDDGIGDASIGQSGIGKQLIRGLIAQLSGRLTVSGSNGTMVTVELPARLFTPPDQIAKFAALVAEPA